MEDFAPLPLRPRLSARLIENRELLQQGLISIPPSRVFMHLAKTPLLSPINHRPLCSLTAGDQCWEDCSTLQMYLVLIASYGKWSSCVTISVTLQK